MNASKTEKIQKNSHFIEYAVLDFKISLPKDWLFKLNSIRKVENVKPASSRVKISQTTSDAKCYFTVLPPSGQHVLIHWKIRTRTREVFLFGGIIMQIIQITWKSVQGNKKSKFTVKFKKNYFHQSIMTSPFYK